MPDGQTFDWGGYHIGVFASHNWAELDTTNDRSEFSTDEDNVWLLGLFGGHRWHLDNNLVLNAQIEAPVFSPSGDAQDTTFFPLPTFNPPVTYEYEVNYAVLLTGQVGYAFGRTLPFVEAGVGRVDVTYRVLNVVGGGTYSPGAVQEASNTHTVWKIGIGVDHAITDYIIAGVKLNYMRSDKQGYEVPWNQPGPNNLGADLVSIGASVSYKF